MVQHRGVRLGQWHLWGLTPARWDRPCSSRRHVQIESHRPFPLVTLLAWISFDFQMTSIIALKRARLAPGYPQAALELFSPKPRVCFESSCWRGCQEMGSERSIPFSGCRKGRAVFSWHGRDSVLRGHTEVVMVTYGLDLVGPGPASGTAFLYRREETHA